jgi:hypothetical protein
MGELVFAYIGQKYEARASYYNFILVKLDI